MTTKLGLVGAGTMGANHARVIATHNSAYLGAVLDHDAQRADNLARGYGAKAVSSLEGLADCDGVVLASPTATHAEIATRLLDMGLPLLVEKPLASDLEQVQRMIRLSRDRGVPLTCGFVERFNPAIRQALSLLNGNPVHIVAIRHSPKPNRVMGSVVHDVAIHDVDLCLQLCGPDIRSIKATGWGPTTNEVEVVDTTIAFGSGTLATISASRWTQRKIRSASITTENQLVEIDMLRQTVTVYRHIEHQITGEGYQAETVMDIPFVRHAGEPLALQLEHFIDLLRGENDVDAERDAALITHVVADSIERQIHGVDS